VPADKLSKVDFELVSEWVTKDQSEIAATTQMKSKRQSRELPAPIPADKLSKVDFELVTEWLTVDQSEEAVELARKIERRNKQTDLTEVAEQTLELPQAEEKEEPPKYIRPEDLDKTVESAVIRFEPAEQLLEKAADTSQDYSFADDLNLVGKVLEGKYAIKSVLAEGGMAILYLANHTTMERTVVVKVVHNYLRSSPSELLRFEREAKVVARLNHPNIVSLYDFGFIDDKLPFIVMEYIRGMNLSQKVIRHGPPRIAVAIRIIKQICFGLEEAHSCGIIHRDLKPDNIILQDKFDRPDWVKLVDFGIAHMLDNKGKRLTRAGLLIGTPEYASPEQFKDLPLDTRSDIYSLGVVFFELFAARLPFDAGSLAGLMTKILLEPAPSVCTYRSDIESGSPIDLLIQKCLEKDPEKRFQTVTEVRLAAEAAYQSE
jgi:tRNA A-37 threonylcarbamoyl transferase component Bud32